MCINVEVIDVNGFSLPKIKYDMENKLKHINPEYIVKIINVNNNHQLHRKHGLLCFMVAII